MKKVLILGAGLVAKPMVNYLLNTHKIEVIIASRTLAKAEKLIGDRLHGKAFQLIVDDDSALENAVQNSDIVISLLPYTFHVKVAKLCLKHQKNMVTTSYVNPAMSELDSQAREKGVLILNEIGLDPGIDHMSAMKIIHEVRERGGKIISFKSYCGGLPAPDSNNNPWRYKFSWSPRGVLMAGRNPARFQIDGKIIEIPGEELFQYRWPIQVGELDLETYPNRDSLPYIDLYGIKYTHTMYRGTLRYPSWCRTLYAVRQLGLLTEIPIENTEDVPYNELFNKILGLSPGSDPRTYITEKLNIPPDDEIIQKLEWLDIFSDKKFSLPTTTPIDFLTTLMMAKMNYSEGERDLIVLTHEFIADYPERREFITSTLIDYGIPGDSSAMSRTVSLPAAIAAKLILEGKIMEKGVRIPIEREIYLPVLEELAALNIVCKENKVSFSKAGSLDQLS
ncbi:MAG: saccharopine dehydrogenase C-terminal domain-containing protein [Calditrichia bacterium]